VAERDKDIRKFQRAARQRIEAASLLKENGYNLEAVYLSGYAIECGLKALIFRRTPTGRFETVLRMLTKAGAKGHDFQYLLEILTRRPISCSVPRGIANAFKNVRLWSTDLRYEVAQIQTDIAALFIGNCESILQWMERSQRWVSESARKRRWWSKCCKNTFRITRRTVLPRLTYTALSFTCESWTNRSPRFHGTNA
jgi:HEPN domain-containing protein